MRKDFYIEFYNNIELILDKYIKRASLQYFFKTIFFEKTYNLKYSYNEDRLNGNSEQQCYSKLETRLLSLLPTKDFITRISKGIKLKDPINPKISFYKNSLIFYIYNNRLLDYLLPIIKEINRPTILLLEPGIYEEIEVPEWIVALEIDYELIQSDEELNYKNDSLIKGLYFKLLVNEILKIIHPDGLVFLEGCHYQEKIAAYLGKELQIPTICIQHGWQSFRHSMFSDMEYDFFLTWGKGFSIEMKKYFPNTELCARGLHQFIQQ